ncbi:MULTISPECIES: hypothetical protein [unclassified Streptomyces]|uniref:hypothetical protein n=1 Tax=unclassified Streptomyces TaxID=2593676 RepID=UPI002E18F461|nr:MULTISPECIES: hypothetical protein [unclassified Streptomyces]
MNRAACRAASISAGLLLCAAPSSTFASPHVTHSTKATAAQTSSTATPHPTLAAKATAKSAKQWQQFRIYGSSTRLRAGTRVTLQQLQRKGWVTLPIHMNTTHSHTYNMRVQLGIKGLNKVRIVGGGAISNTVRITIR